MRRLACLVVAGVLLAAGCGSSKKSSATATTAATTSTTGVGISSTTAPTFSGSQNSSFCNAARQFAGIDVSKVASDPKAFFLQFDQLAGQLVAEAPSEIKADATTVVNAIKQIETAVKAVNYDQTKLDPASLAFLQDPKFTAAGSRIGAYATQVCGISTSTT